MRKEDTVKKKLLIVSLVLLLGGLLYKNKEASSYRYYTSSFENISVSEFYELKDMPNEEIYFVYFGRSTCPYCQKFVKGLREAAKETNTNIYYVDTEKTETSASLKKLREELSIRLVPSLVRVDTEEHQMKKMDLKNQTKEDVKKVLEDK